MGTEIQKYSRRVLRQSTRTLTSSADQVYTEIQRAYHTANIKGRFRQLEADIILEYELGFPPRRKKKDQSW